MEKGDIEFMYCMNCGNKLEEGGRFCTACGTSVKGLNDNKIKQEKEGSNRDSELVTENKRKKLPWGFITFSVIVIGAVLLLANVHTCNWCHKTYVGAQYYDIWDTSELMCKDCALEYYMGPGYKNYKK